MASNIDYRSNYFEHATLTKIHGEPTYDTLQRLHNELKSNATAVPTTLGGGAHGHLGLVVSPARYALVSNVPYVRPPPPGMLILPPNVTDQVAMIHRDNHAEHVRVFREVTAVEKALLQQIVAAVEHVYLQPLRNRESQSISIPIYDVIEFLFRVYGKISSRQIAAKQEELRQQVYDPSTPIDTMFNSINDLADYAAQGKAPFTQQQIINFGYDMLNNTGKFGSYLREWNRKPTEEQTWTNFQEFFRVAREELKDTSNLRADDTQYHANMVKEIINGIKNEINSANSQNLNEDQQYYNIPDLYANQAGSIAPSIDPTIASLQTEISALRSSITQIHQAFTSGVYPNTYFAQPAMQQPPISVITGQNSTATPSPTCNSPTPPTDNKKKNWKYCWTHGCQLSHDGPSCKYKAQNHKDEATFSNMMGGCQRGISKYKREQNE